MLTLNHEKAHETKKGWKSKLNDDDSNITLMKSRVNEGVEKGTNPFPAIFHKEHTSW